MANNIVHVVTIFMGMILVNFASESFSNGTKLAIFDGQQVYINQTYQECNFMTGCFLKNLDCRFLDSIRNISKEYYPNLKDAQNAVKTGKVWGALYLSENFTDAWVAKAVLQEDSDEETVDQSEIKVWLSEINNQSTKYAEDLQRAFTKAAVDLIEVCESGIFIGTSTLSLKNISFIN